MSAILVQQPRLVRRPRGRASSGSGRRFVAGPVVGLFLALLAAGCLPSSVRTTVSPDQPASGASPSLAPATPSPTPGPPTPKPGPSFATYKVVRGDNLTSIANRFHTSPRSLAYWNRDRYPTLDPESAKYEPNNLKAGWVLRVMPNAEYSPSPDDGETGIDSTPTPPEDAIDAPSPGGSAGTGASPGASSGG